MDTTPPPKRPAAGSQLFSAIHSNDDDSGHTHLSNLLRYTQLRAELLNSEKRNRETEISPPTCNLLDPTASQVPEPCRNTTPPIPWPGWSFPVDAQHVKPQTLECIQTVHVQGRGDRNCRPGATDRPERRARGLAGGYRLPAAGCT